MSEKKRKYKCQSCFSYIDEQDPYVAFVRYNQDDGEEFQIAKIEFHTRCFVEMAGEEYETLLMSTTIEVCNVCKVRPVIYLEERICNVCAPSDRRCVEPGCRNYKQISSYYCSLHGRLWQRY